MKTLIREKELKYTDVDQKSGWRRMRSCHGAEQRVNNLEKSDLLGNGQMKYIDVEGQTHSGTHQK